MTPEQALQEAIRIVGSRVKLAAELGVSAAAVGQWKVCPVKRALKVEEAVKRALERSRPIITRYDLCPEAFGHTPVSRETLATKGE